MAQEKSGRNAPFFAARTRMTWSLIAVTETLAEPAVSTTVSGFTSMFVTERTEDEGDDRAASVAELRHPTASAARRRTVRFPRQEPILLSVVVI